MKVAVIGAGAMGSILGGRLAASGNDVWLVDIWKDHVSAIQKNGLDIVKDEKTLNVKVNAVTSAEDVFAQAGAVELVLIFVKGIYTDQAIQDALRLVGPDTYVLTVQNGLGNADVIAKYVPRKRVLVGTTLSAGGVLSPGRVADTSTSTFTQIMAMEGDGGAKAKEIAAALNAAGWQTEYTPEAELAIWNKLCVNCCTNAVSTVTRFSCGQVCTPPYGRELLTDIIGEVCAVANAKGLPMDPEKTCAHIFEVYTQSKHYPSMLQDAKKKNKTEVDTITGAVVREGERLGVPTPVNRTIYNLISMITSNYDQQWY